MTHTDDLTSYAVTQMQFKREWEKVKDYVLGSTVEKWAVACPPCTRGPTTEDFKDMAKVLDEAAVPEPWYVIYDDRIETLPSNGCLSTYTSSVNNVEDRTMNAKNQLHQVQEQIDELNKKLRSECHMAGNVLLTAELSSQEGRPEEKGPFLSDAWEISRKRIDAHYEALAQGKMPMQVIINMRSLSTLNPEIKYKDSLEETIEEFRHSVEKEYAYKLMNLRRKEYALAQIVENEAKLDQPDRKPLFSF